MDNIAWKSEGFRLTTATCVDVEADVHGVVLGQVGDVWLHNLHMSDTEADAIGNALKDGARACRAAQQAQS